MYGYDPKRPVREGSWRETMIFVQAALEVIVPLMGIFMAIIAAVVVSLGLLLVDARLIAIPGTLLLVGAVLLWRRERRKQSDETTRIEKLPH